MPLSTAARFPFYCDHLLLNVGERRVALERPTQNAQPCRIFSKRFQQIGKTRENYNILRVHIEGLKQLLLRLL